MGDSLGIPGAVGFCLLSLWPPSCLLWSQSSIPHSLPASLSSQGAPLLGPNTPQPLPPQPVLGQQGGRAFPAHTAPPPPPFPAHPRHFKGDAPHSLTRAKPTAATGSQSPALPLSLHTTQTRKRSEGGGGGGVRCGRNLRLAPWGWRVGTEWVDTRTQQRAAGASRPQTPHVPQPGLPGSRTSSLPRALIPRAPGISGGPARAGDSGW